MKDLKYKYLFLFALTIILTGCMDVAYFNPVDNYSDVKLGLKLWDIPDIKKDDQYVLNEDFYVATANPEYQFPFVFLIEEKFLYPVSEKNLSSADRMLSDAEIRLFEDKNGSLLYDWHQFPFVIQTNRIKGKVSKETIIRIEGFYSYGYYIAFDAAGYLCAKVLDLTNKKTYYISLGTISTSLKNGWIKYCNKKK
ncbi:MAG: hypothetical protein E7058_06815 [Lentisphaerae bacterium]|nr:hypothetical protein [Lentisphaerota bacterium]